jgi:hypothetical protein
MTAPQANNYRDNGPDADAPSSEMVERLTAYLDGELDAAETRAVEAQIAADPAWARELQRLERAWNLLDRLPRHDVSADFTQSTVEMAALDAAAAIVEVAQPRPQRRWGDRGLALGGLIATAVAGFLLVDALRPRRDDELLRSLPLLRHFEVYSRTEPGETAEFARLLRDRGTVLFPAAPPAPEPHGR